MFKKLVILVLVSISSLNFVFAQPTTSIVSCPKGQEVLQAPNGDKNNGWQSWICWTPGEPALQQFTEHGRDYEDKLQVFTDVTYLIAYEGTILDSQFDGPRWMLRFTNNFGITATFASEFDAPGLGQPTAVEWIKDQKTARTRKYKLTFPHDITKCGELSWKETSPVLWDCEK